MTPFMARLLTILVLLVMVVFSFTPVPGTTLIMLYVVLFRPRWFKRLVDLIYAEAGQPAPLAEAVSPAYGDPPEEKKKEEGQGIRPRDSE